MSGLKPPARARVITALLGADIANQLRCPEGVADGIHSLNEHWRGCGRPQVLRAEAMPINTRMAGAHHDRLADGG